MANCLTVHEHPEFLKSYNPQDKKQEYEVTKLKRYLRSENGDSVGEYLKYDFPPFKSFPRGETPIRCLFVLCKDCNGEAVSPACDACASVDHTMNDVVLFYVTSNHKDAYKIGKKVILSYLKK
ncbi:MAG: hypothetical protein WC412_08240 [Candidatus Omnitrophota bacterium]|jgi:hypothetical protein